VRFRFLVALSVAWVSACGQGASSPTRTPASAVPELGSGQLIVSTTIRPAEDPGSYGIPKNSLWVDVVFDAKTPTERVAAEWEGMLIAQGDRLKAAGADTAPIEGVSFFQQESVGPSTFVRNSPFESANPTPAGPNPHLSEQELRTQVDDWARKLGLVIVSVTFETHGDVGPAPLVVARTTGSDAVAFVQAHPFAVEEIEISDASAFADIVDKDGTSLEAVGIVPVSETTTSWHSPTVPGCFTAACPTEPEPNTQ